MRYLNKSFLALLCAAGLLGACDTEDTYDVLDIEVPVGYALSAGTSTLFVRSSKAYDMPASWVTGAYNSRFNSGDGLYDDVRTSGNTDGGGLGPVYAGYSCGSCHRNAGRTTPTLWTEGGTGSTGFSSMLVYVSRKNGAFFRDYGRVLHDQAIYGVEPEGKLHVDWRYEKFRFPDGEEYELAAPTYTITEWYADSIAPEDLFCTVRIPLRHVGLGQMMAIDTKEIEALAAKSNYPEYGISGRCNYITEKGVRGVGLSGNKAQHLDLTVELGFSSDMGVTNSRYPEEICEGQAQINQGSMMGLSYDQLDISAEDMEDVDLYMQALGVPARRDVDDPQVQLGEQMFYRLHPADGHTSALAGRADHPPVFRLPAARHGQRDHGRRPQRQLCQRTGPRQRVAHHPALGHRPAGDSEWTHLLPARRPRPQLRRGHHVARGRGRGVEEPLQEHVEDATRRPGALPPIVVANAGGARMISREEKFQRR